MSIVARCNRIWLSCIVFIVNKQRSGRGTDWKKEHRVANLVEWYVIYVLNGNWAFTAHVIVYVDMHLTLFVPSLARV